MFSKMLFKSVVIVFSSFIFVQGFKPPKCRGKEVQMKPEELERMGECVKEYSTGGSASFAEVPMTKMGCLGKCILKKEGLADEKGMPVKENVYKMVNGTLDEEIIGMATDMLGKCIDEKSAEIDIREKACNTYWPLVQCIMVAFQEICADPDASTKPM